MSTTMPRPLTPVKVARYVRTVEGFTAGVVLDGENERRVAEARARIEALRTKRRTERAIAKARALTWPEVDRRRDHNLLVRVDLACQFRRVDDRPMSNWGGL